MTANGRLWRLMAALGGCAVAAAWLFPNPIAAWGQLGPLLTHSVSDQRAVNALTLAVSSIAVWGLLVWLATSVFVLLAIRLPGRLGGAARAASRLIVPAVIRRLLCGALSLSMAGGILAGTAQASNLHDSRSITPASVGRQLSPELDWPIPDGQRPSPADKAGPRQQIGPNTVTVKPGDCLWDIAAKSLGPTATKQAIATKWPAWWERNRKVIGDNPSLIHPGQVLHRPGAQHSTKIQHP